MNGILNGLDGLDEVLRSLPGHYGYTSMYLLLSTDNGGFPSSAKIDVMLELAKLDLQKGTTAPELIFYCCRVFFEKEALEKLIELGKQNGTDKEVVKNVLEFRDQVGNCCLTIFFRDGNCV